MLIWIECIKKVDTGGVFPATHVILHRWQDTMPSRQQGLPEIEEEHAKRGRMGERNYKEGQHEREFKDEGRLGKKNWSNKDWSEQKWGG